MSNYTLLKFFLHIKKNEHHASTKSENEDHHASISRDSQKQPSRGVPIKRCSEDMQQIYRRAPIAKRNFKNNCKAILLKSHFGMSVLL